MLRIQSAENWAASKVAGFPARWQRKLLAGYRSQVNAAESLPCVSGEGGRGHASWQAGRDLCDITDRLGMVRLSLDASDSEICARAAEFAVQAMDLARMNCHTIEAVRVAMEVFCWSVKVVPPGVQKIDHPVLGGVWVWDNKMETRPAIARMTCRDWWRRGLRKMHANAVEAAAIRLGYVNRARDLYVSNESLERRGQQIRRNQRMLESTVMRNELEQEFTLAELAATGTANKAIRRGELMTRIAGFERIAIDCKHGGLFLTTTCPSRMHKWVSAGGGKVYENPKYDGTTPKEAQAYMSKCWARVRAALDRRGLKVYGFRIAEPHHDGCPHWHMLLFHEAGQQGLIEEVFRRYLLADSPGERGASEHRVKVEVIDWSRGTAAGYIAKYVAKNIDGLHVENDLYGNPAMETSMRVEAWAATWGIRQFQQIGGAPVGVWRELRRVREVPEGAPEHLRVAHAAVNRVEGEGETKSADWAGYVQAQGGVFVGRDYRIRIVAEQPEEVGRYGEPMAPRPVGVEATGGEIYRDGIIPDRFRLVEWFVRSARHVWERVKRGIAAAVFSPPRTCVNNCTRGDAGRVEEKPRGGVAFDDSWFVSGAFG